jgi:hypothetical protein
MKKIVVVLLAFLLCCINSHAQEVKHWTESDRKYLLENLIRSRNELINETKGLTRQQWQFKESPDRWSINEIVEHIALWELLLEYRITRQLDGGLQPARAMDALPDSVVFNFIMEEKKHHSPDYTQPFTYTLPMGLNSIESNISWVSKMRKEAIDHVSKTSSDLRQYYVSDSESNTHQVYITLFGHADRHIRQIRKVKQHPAYPKNN